MRARMISDEAAAALASQAIRDGKKTLTISAKCSDLCFCSFHNEDSGNTFEKDGYVPGDIGLGGGGDYIKLTIDATTGQIEGWKPLDSIDVVRKGFKKV